MDRAGLCGLKSLRSSIVPVSVTQRGIFMIEVLFGESEAGAMKVAKNKVVSIASDGPTAIFCAGKKRPPSRENTGWIEGTSSEVICLAFMLDVGEIDRDVDGEYRKNLICSMLDQGQWGEDGEPGRALMEAADRYAGELRRLRGFLEAGEDIRIWYSRGAYSLCGLYHVCSVIRPYRNRLFLVELPEYRVTENTVVCRANWGEIAAEEFASFLGGQKEIGQIEIERYAMLWAELVGDNSPLRAVIGNHVVGVQEDFYDFLIWKHLTEEPVREARLIGNILGQHPISVGDWWYAKRIQYHIDCGGIEIAEDSEWKYARLIKRSSGVNTDR